MVFKWKRNISNLDPYLLVNAIVSKLPWPLPQVQYFVKRASDYLYYRLEATVANNVHTAYWLVTPFAEKQKLAPGGWGKSVRSAITLAYAQNPAHPYAICTNR